MRGEARQGLNRFKASPLRGALLFILTLGIYSFVWQKRKIEFLNAMGTEDELSYAKWVNLTLQTCGIYHFYHEMVVGREIAVLKNRIHGVPKPHKARFNWILCIISLGLIYDISHQIEINKIVDELTR
jgi:hypothetical protein